MPPFKRIPRDLFYLLFNKKNIFSYALITAGLIMILFSILADLLGFGKGGIQSAQILGIEFGSLIVCMGIFIFILKDYLELTLAELFLNLKDRIINLPPLAWVLIGMIPPIVLFVVSYMFFNNRNATRYPVDYLPAGVSVGADINVYLSASAAWINHEFNRGFITNPLTTIILSPLLLLDYPGYYFLISGLTLFSYLLMLALGLLICNPKNHSAVVFIAVLSLFSFGVQFEIERGQFYSFSFMLALLAIYIFHEYKYLRIFSYLLFSLAVQLKYVPALLIFMFVDDWRAWKKIILRFSLLGAVNILPLFLFGFNPALSFMDFTSNKLLTDVEFSIRNHSIQSSVAVFSSRGFGLLNENALEWTRAHSVMIAVALVCLYFVCLISVLVRAYLKNEGQIDVGLLLVCVIGGMVLPAISHDYKLPLLTIPFALVISNSYLKSYPFHKIFLIVITIICSIAYSLTLIPFQFKPEYLQNNLLMIYILLISTTFLTITGRKKIHGSDDKLVDDH